MKHLVQINFYKQKFERRRRVFDADLFRCKLKTVPVDLKKLKAKLLKIPN